jgi:hypothetical protein
MAKRSSFTPFATAGAGLGVVFSKVSAVAAVAVVAAAAAALVVFKNDRRSIEYVPNQDE